MTFKRALLVALAMSLVGGVLASNAAADEWDKKTVLTFSRDVEVPGYVLPAGTYTFQLVDSMSDRHIVRISNHDGSRHIGLVMAIPNYRLDATDETVIKFNEALRGQPEPIRAWFYPGNKTGQEFVYPKRRALELASTSRVVVPAIAVETPEPDLKTVPIVAITPDRREVDVATVIQTTPSADKAPQLPQTASPLPLVSLFGVLAIGMACGLMLFKRHGATL